MNVLSIKPDNTALDINLLLNRIYSNQIDNIDLSNKCLPDYMQTHEIIESTGIKKHDTIYSPIICLSSKKVLTAY